MVLFNFLGGYSTAGFFFYITPTIHLIFGVYKQVQKEQILEISAVCREKESN